MNGLWPGTVSGQHATRSRTHQMLQSGNSAGHGNLHAGMPHTKPSSHEHAGQELETDDAAAPNPQG
eukprot:12044958-Heterocapsa_arctica.AAC.1